MTLTNEQKIQGSADWLALRKTKITATDISCIMGASTYMTPYELWEQKIGLKEPPEENEGMRIGRKYEDKIRKWANENFNCNFEPDVVIHPEMPFILASLDGIDYEKKIIIEAKTCNEELFRKIKDGHIPYGFYIQQQIQLECVGFKKSYLCAYNPKLDEMCFQLVEWDECRCQEYINAARSFKFCVDNLVSPALNAEDYECIDETDEMKELISQYKECKHMLVTFEDIEKKLKNEIVERVGKRNAKGLGVKITKVIKRGSVDYESLFKDHEIDKDVVNDYRKPDTEYFKISEVV